MDCKLKVLCLHGYRQDGNKFRVQTGSLRKILKNLVDFDFISAPHKVEDDGETSRSWWFTTGTSFSSRDSPEDCEGLKESIELVEKTWRENGPYDGLLGFSQGACFVGVLAALQQKGDVHIDPKFVALFSGFKSRTKTHKDFYAEPIKIPSLHVVGETDEVIPFDWGLDLASSFSHTIVIKHPGGHFVPGTSVLKQEYQDFFNKQRTSCTER